MNLLERWLFPRSKFLNFLTVVCLSAVFSFLLTGRQIFEANWSLIDDHETFYFLGPALHLSLSDVWNTFLTKTEIGSQAVRFRPSYYLIRLVEIAVWGTNVHLWYLRDTIYSQFFSVRSGGHCCGLSAAGSAAF